MTPDSSVNSIHPHRLETHGDTAQPPRQGRCPQTAGPGKESQYIIFLVIVCHFVCGSVACSLDGGIVVTGSILAWQVSTPLMGTTGDIDL